jgi:hypothetical protein
MATYPVYAPKIQRLGLAPLHNATTSDTNFGLASSQNFRAQTNLAYIYVTGDGENAFGYIFGKTVSGSTTGTRLFYGSLNTVTFGDTSTGTAGAPNAVSVGVFGDNNFAHVAATWDGGVAASGIQVYIGQNNNPLADTGMTGLANGTGAAGDVSANVFHIGNREGTDRTFNGTIYYLARWNRVLPLWQLRYAQLNGPLSVPDGLMLCWANNQDYSPTRLAYTSQTAVLMTGRPPLNPYLQRVPVLPNYFNIPAVVTARSYTYVLG